MIDLVVLKQRARALKSVREFFDSRGFLEIQTPALRFTAAMDPYIDSFSCQWRDFRGTTFELFLQSSPEYAIKTWLGSQHHPPDVYEIARVFRNEPESDKHLREFTMIEWYHVGASFSDMMDESEALVRHVADALGCKKFAYGQHTVDVDQDFERLSVGEAFDRFAGFDPLPLSKDELLHACRQFDIRVNDDWSWDDIFNCILIDKVEHRLGCEKPTFLYAYPPSQASLAKLAPDGKTAHRFELYACGLELCNAYDELCDADIQRERFLADNATREDLSYRTLPVDRPLLDALRRLPPTSGNALGFERLLMLLLHFDDIHDCCINDAHIFPAK